MGLRVMSSALMAGCPSLYAASLLFLRKLDRVTKVRVALEELDLLGLTLVRISVTQDVESIADVYNVDQAISGRIIPDKNQHLLV